jgi:hypothetical protein
MATNWGGQTTGGTTAMQQYNTGGWGNTAGWGQQYGGNTGTYNTGGYGGGFTNQFGQNTTQYGSGNTGLSNIGGGAIGSGSGSKGGAAQYGYGGGNTYGIQSAGANQYNRDAAQQGQDWVNQANQQGNGNTTINGTTYNSQGQQLDSNGNVASGSWGNDGSGGGGNSATGGGQQGAARDYIDPVTGQTIYAWMQGNNWNGVVQGLPRDGDVTSGEGAGLGQTQQQQQGQTQQQATGGANWALPLNMQQYTGMNAQQQGTMNNWLANNLQYNQGQQNAYQYEQDRAQSAMQFALQHGLNLEQFAAQNGISQQQLKMAQEAQAFNQQNTQAYQNMDYANMYYNQGIGNRQMTLQELQNKQAQQQWGQQFVLNQGQQQHQQGMDVKGLQLAQLKEEHDYYVQTGQLDLAKKTQEQYYNIQQGQLGLATVANQRQNEQFYAGQANEMQKFGQNLDWQKNQFGQQLGQQKYEFGQTMGQRQHEFTSQLDFEKEKNKQQYGLAVDNFQLDKMVKTGELKLSQDKLGQQQYEFGQQMDFEKQKNAQQFGLAVDNFQLNKMIQTGELDLSKQKFGQQQYEFGQTFGEGQRQFNAAQQQQMAIEQARLAQAERAANVAAVGRTLAPSAKWLRAT